MIWLVALGVLALAVFSPGFRALLGVLFVLALLVGGAVFMYVRYEQNAHIQQEDAARRRVAPSEVSLDDATLGPQYGSSYRLLARARNSSSLYTVRSIVVAITLRDCPTQTVGEENCEIVGEKAETVYVRIPPGQARDLDESIYFSPSPMIHGRMSWSFSIGGVAADE